MRVVTKMEAIANALHTTDLCFAFIRTFRRCISYSRWLQYVMQSRRSPIFYAYICTGINARQFLAPCFRTQEIRTLCLSNILCFNTTPHSCMSLHAFHAVLRQRRGLFPLVQTPSFEPSGFSHVGNPRVPSRTI